MVSPLAHLRAHSHGTLLADGHPFSVRYVIDAKRSRLLFNVEPIVLDAAEHTLHVPEESPTVGAELELLLDASALPTSDPLIDRWLAAHAPLDPLATDVGKAPHTHWLAGLVDTARFGGQIFDGLDLGNPLGDREPAYRRRINADRGWLGRLCADRVGIVPVEPLCLGLDPDGLDVRAANATLPIRVPLAAGWTDRVAADGSNVLSVLSME